MSQLNLPSIKPRIEAGASAHHRLSALPNRRQLLEELVRGDLDFKGQDSSYASHNFHAFAAKFPPQIPRTFIEGLTLPGEVVLDPMMGSGTALLEAYLHDRQSVGFDLDPLAIRQSQVKTTWVSADLLKQTTHDIISAARSWLLKTKDPEPLLHERYTPKAVEFIQYWFLPETQLQLLALLESINRLPEGHVRDFIEVAFSAIIVTKSGGVSMARDLAHSRPHRVADKIPRDALQQFEARVRKNIRNLAALPEKTYPPVIRQGDARQLPLEEASIDLVITSPPYANAIDYMRAHKFSLVWFGARIEDLALLRSRYIGAERTSNLSEVLLPPRAEEIISHLTMLDKLKARILRKYYADMQAAIEQMYRVLRPDRTAVIVVGSSTMRGIDVETHYCLADLAVATGFDVVGVFERKIDRDKRMMPARFGARNGSGIEDRMHHEYVIAAYKA
jgi:DNA modification methylase